MFYWTDRSEIIRENLSVCVTESFAVLCCIVVDCWYE